MRGCAHAAELQQTPKRDRMGEQPTTLQPAGTHISRRGLAALRCWGKGSPSGPKQHSAVGRSLKPTRRSVVRPRCEGTLGGLLPASHAPQLMQPIFPQALFLFCHGPPLRPLSRILHPPLPHGPEQPSNQETARVFAPALTAFFFLYGVDFYLFISHQDRAVMKLIIIPASTCHEAGGKRS